MWLALDIGGTKFAAGLYSTGGEAYGKDRIPVDHSLDGEGLFESLLAMVRRLIHEVAGNEYADVVDGIGIGCGGPMRWPVGDVSPLNIHAWRDFPLRARIAELWPRLPVRLINDAMTMAIGEHWLGAGVGSRAMLGVVVSTGVGGGVVLEGRVLAGDTGNAGHIGHMVVDPHGPFCACGGRGCLEAIARGPAIVDWAIEQGWKPPNDQPSGPDLVEAARAGAEIPLASLTRAGQALGVALASAAHLIDLDRVVIGGGMATGAGELILAPAVKSFERHARMDYVRRCKIVPASAGHEAGLVGAAALVASDRYWPWNAQ